MSQQEADDGAALSQPSRLQAAVAGLRRRMKGPGGYYNLGNVIGFAVAAMQAALAGGATSVPGGSVLVSLKEYLVGSPSAVAMSVAMVIFFMSGEAYFKAWRDPARPYLGLVRLGDALSAVAALVLCISLILLGNVALALASSLLLVGGKFGSALRPGASWVVQLQGLPGFDPFRVAVILSRVPALLTIAAGLAADATSSAVLIQQVTLLICYGLWLRADLMLFRVH